MSKPGTGHFSGRGVIARQGLGALNLTLAIVLLASIASIAWHNHAQASPGVGESHVNSAQQAATPTAETECEPHGPLRYTPDELLAMSFDDWPEREYTPLEAAPLEIGQAAVATYELSRICALLDLERNAQADPGNLLAPSEASMTYYSDRWQRFILKTTTVEVLDDETREFLMNGGDRQLVEQGALPVNRPMTWHSDADPLFMFPSFTPGDVYVLTDGRYGVMIGTISAQTILSGRGSGAGIQDGGLIEFLAFVDIDGTLYVDERIVVCVTDFLIPAPGGTPATGNEPASTQSTCHPG